VFAKVRQNVRLAIVERVSNGWSRGSIWVIVVPIA
jgi:hypothetical protein